MWIILGLTIVLYVMVKTWNAIGFVAALLTVIMMAALVFLGVGCIDLAIKKTVKRFNSVIEFTCGILTR